MAFQVSPSVVVTEVDQTNIVPSVSSSTGATVIASVWGPVEEVTIVSNEDQLASIFGKPTGTLYKDWLCAASFLAYASDLRVVRVVDDLTAKNSTANASEGTLGMLVKNRDVYDSLSLGSATDLWIAKYPGELGDSIGVAWADTAGFNLVDSNGDNWLWKDLFDSAPGSNEYHIVVFDFLGRITGTAGTVLETFSFVSTEPTAKYYDGTSGYFKNKVNDGSAWVYVANPSLLSGTTAGIGLEGGEDGSLPSAGDKQRGFALYQNTDELDISLVFAAGADSVTSKWIIDNIAEYRKDCLAFVSPEEEDVVGIFSETAALNNVLERRDSYGSSSYAVMDSAYKTMYDRYNDVNRYIPLNGDVAGLCAKTDNDRDPWFAPAGYERGRFKNTIKLTQKQPIEIRNELFKKGVNPCVFMKVEGPIFLGDKTLLSRPSAFDAINVRRLFIVLEKAISTAAKHLLFEQNNEFTRTRFINMVEPFLREVAGREGITDFRVVCDTSNNSPEVVDRNEFVADIYIKPTRAIRFIRLNFVAVRTGVSFNEIVQGDAPGLSL